MSSARRAHVRHKTRRLIASRYPTIGVFDDIAQSDDDLRIAFLLESITNDRHALLARRLAFLPPGEIVQGPTASIVMAAFLHADEAGTRFTDARLGAWYASFEIETAIVETGYHNERRLRLSDGGFPTSIQIRELIATIDADLRDIRGQQKRHPELYHSADYSQSQVWAASLRWPTNSHAENGIVYDSIRRTGGTNVCVFSPRLIPLPIVQGDHYDYRWNASGQLTVSKLTNVSIA